MVITSGRFDVLVELVCGDTDELLSIEGWEIPSDMMDEVRYTSDHLGPEIQAAYARVAAQHGR